MREASLARALVTRADAKPSMVTDRRRGSVDEGEYGQPVAEMKAPNLERRSERLRTHERPARTASGHTTIEALDEDVRRRHEGVSLRITLPRVKHIHPRKKGTDPFFRVCGEVFIWRWTLYPRPYRRRKEREMKFVIIGARVILGLLFVVSGLNGFFQFMANPEMNETITAFMMALGGTGYFMIVVKLVEVTSGLMILTGRFLPLGLILLAPVSVHIFFAHLFLDQAGLPMAIVIIVLQLFLAWAYRDSYSGILQAKAEPT